MEYFALPLFFHYEVKNYWPCVNPLTFFSLETAKTDVSIVFKGFSLGKSITIFCSKCFPDGLPNSSV